MTVRLFWEDPYATSNDAVVTVVDSVDVELDRSVLFAFSGGQESDLGWIGGHRRAYFGERDRSFRPS